MNKKLLILAISGLALVACGDGTSHSETPSTPSISTSQQTSNSESESLSPSETIGSENTGSTSTTPDPVEDNKLIHEMIQALIEDSNYTMTVRSADDETFVTKILPNAFYFTYADQFITENIAYAENDEGIFGYEIEDDIVSPITKYLTDDTGDKLHGLYTTQIENNWGDTVYLTHSFSLVDAQNFVELNANADGTFDIDIDNVLPLLDELLAQSFMYDSVSHIGLTDDKAGLEIKFSNTWSSATLTVSDIGTTAIDPITNYLAEGNGALEDDVDEPTTLADKVKEKLALQNYIVNGTEFYRIITENFVVDGFTGEGFIKLPEKDDRSAGIYDFDPFESTLGERNYSVSSLSQLTGVFPANLVDSLIEMEGKLISDGSVESMITLMDFSNNFDSTLMENNKFIGAVEIEYFEDSSLMYITGYVYDLETIEWTNETIKFSLTQFGSSTYDFGFLDDFYNSLI